MQQINQLAAEWLRLDKDSSTRAEIQDLLESKNEEELEKRLRDRISFGTAGLRGRMGAGFSRMNSLTVIQASQGLAAYVLETVPSAISKGVVIGHDARYNSEKFAKLAAAAFLVKGIKVWWYEDLVHTPLVPFGVLELGAATGVMVTASHNPAQDNGYKVYWTNGCQIIPPHDIGIAESIQNNLEPLSWDLSAIDANPLVENILHRVKQSYFAAIGRLKTVQNFTQCQSQPQFVYTPMHGVGLPYMTEMVKILGLLGHMTVVDEQAHPDPEFPTVRFPNPEEKGALELAMGAAERNNITFVIASDPDADRLGVAEKVSGKWHQLTGNQLGVLLASHVLSTYPAQCSLSKMAMLDSAVSTAMLHAMAVKEGFKFEETLTGFKWMGNAALELRRQGYDACFAFEESIGYMFTDVIPDKDSIAAAAVFLSAMCRWKVKEGVTPWQKLQQLYARFGHFQCANTYFVSPSPTVTNRIFDTIRLLGSPYPAKVGNRNILRWRDLTQGYDSSTVGNYPELPVSKDSQMITCELDGNVKFTVRGSGTEPKIKGRSLQHLVQMYIECQADSSEQAQKGANEVLKALSREWLKPTENGLMTA